MHPRKPHLDRPIGPLKYSGLQIVGVSRNFAPWAPIGKWQLGRWEIGLDNTTMDHWWFLWVVMWGVFAFGSWMLSIGIPPPCPILCHALELQNTCWGKDTACSCHACHACGRPGSNTCTALETWQIRLPDYTIQITTEGRHVVSLQQADIRVIRVTQCLKKQVVEWGRTLWKYMLSHRKHEKKILNSQVWSPTLCHVQIHERQAPSTNTHADGISKVTSMVCIR